MQSLDTARKLANFIAVLALGLLAFTFIAREEINTYQFGCATVAPEGYCGTADFNALSNHKGYLIFQCNCKTCHRLDQKLVGPPLRHSYERRDSVWLRKWIRNANSLIKSGDTLAIAVYNEYDQTSQPAFENFTNEELDDLIEYLKLASEESIVVQ